jgi:hypothetical protein
LKWSALPLPLGLLRPANCCERFMKRLRHPVVRPGLAYQPGGSAVLHSWSNSSMLRVKRPGWSSEVPRMRKLVRMIDEGGMERTTHPRASEPAPSRALAVRTSAGPMVRATRFRSSPSSFEMSTLRTRAPGTSNTLEIAKEGSDAGQCRPRTVGRPMDRALGEWFISPRSGALPV